MEAQAKKPSKRPTKIEEMTKEQIREAIIKKRECNAKAQSIVESLLEKIILEDYFLNCLSHINQTHFEDIIEERSILHLCGYPLCQNTLSVKDIPKQKYRISMKSNKVYDITARKSFCSNICYKSAMHIKKQMLTSPLWFREYEVLPKFHLLPMDSVGSMGQEVDLSLTEKIVMQSERQTFTSINDFTSATLNEMDSSPNNNKENDNALNNNYNIESSTTNLNNIQDNSRKIGNKVDMLQGNCQTGNDLTVNDKTSNNTIALKEDSKLLKKTTNNLLNIVGEVVEKPVKPVDPILTNLPQNLKQDNPTSTDKISQKKQPSNVAITIEVEKSLAEWFSVDTLIFIYGEEKVKKMVEDKGECIQEYLNNYSKHIAYSSSTYDQYQALCRKLTMLELADKHFDAQTLPRETKPLPEYSILKEESKKMQLKVKAFFSGETEIPDIIESIDDQNESKVEEKTQLPLVDKNAQNALRRRIVCNNLNKVLSDLLRSLGLLNYSISSDIRLLVNTFKLKANNITFKPVQWMLIALVFIKLISIRNRGLQHLLEKPMAFQHMQLLLLSYKQDGGYLDRLISWLTDIDRLLDVNDTQLTIE